MDTLGAGLRGIRASRGSLSSVIAALTSRARVAPKRNATGLTTLEWLLIVAAVAGLAALAVVLVQNVVDDTAEEISGNNARITAARVAAKAITDEGEDNAPSACNRLNITYSDVLPDADREAHWDDPNTTCEIRVSDAYIGGLAMTNCTGELPSNYDKVKVKWDTNLAPPKCVRA